LTGAIKTNLIFIYPVQRRYFVLYLFTKSRVLLPVRRYFMLCSIPLAFSCHLETLVSHKSHVIVSLVGHAEPPATSLETCAWAAGSWVPKCHFLVSEHYS